MKRSEIIGKNLVELRLSRGYTQAEISEIIGMPQTTYAGYETGRHEPNISNLILLAELYNTSLDYLAGRYSQTPTEELPERFIDELIHMNSIERKNEDIENIADRIESEQEEKRLNKEALAQSARKARGKYNRVKTNKPKERK